MPEEHYDVTLHTPMGKRRGDLLLNLETGEAELEIARYGFISGQHEHSDGTEHVFSGIMRSLLGEEPFTLHVSEKAETLTGYFMTRKGKFTLSGKHMERDTNE